METRLVLDARGLGFVNALPGNMIKSGGWDDGLYECMVKETVPGCWYILNCAGFPWGLAFGSPTDPFLVCEN